MARAYSGYGTKQRPQSEPIPGSSQVPNSAGGYAFAVDDWTRLERFLILGSEGGTYYIGERTLTRENAQAVERCIKADPSRTLNVIREISEAGRAPKNDPALFALAMVFAQAPPNVKPLASRVLLHVARTGTHLLHFVAYAEQFRGWGRTLRSAVANWYLSKTPEQLAYQLVKYQSRDKWSQRDLLRLSHPKASGALNDVLHWAVKGWPDIGDGVPAEKALALLWSAESAKRVPPGQASKVCSLIRDYRLPREAIPNEWLTDSDVWQALLDEPMPMTAMIRNLATMTRIGLLGDLQPATSQVTAALRDAERIHKARVHPIQLLAALKTYQQGHGERSKNTWTPARQIVDALDAAFYTSFENVVPTGKRWMLALDVSGSMEWGTIAGVPGLTPRVASAALALITAATEPNYMTFAFAAPGMGPGRYGGMHGGGEAGFMPLTISPRQRLDDVIKTVSNLPFGGTDCSLPMVYALRNKLPVDVFAVYTDSETWAGPIHPVQALREYRNKMGIPAKLIVVGMTSNSFSIADPTDAGMLDCVGFDTATPSVMADFARS